MAFSKEKRKVASGGGVQATMINKEYKEEVDAQHLQKCELIRKYRVGYKAPSYHDVREKLLKQVVGKTDAMLERVQGRVEENWCTIISISSSPVQVPHSSSQSISAFGSLMTIAKHSSIAIPRNYAIATSSMNPSSTTIAMVDGGGSPPLA
ncbi:hypothetical protein CR513_23211, partial [Mucuna pruriens]